MVNFKERLRDSIQARLSFWLSLAIIAVGLVAGSISFALAFHEASEMQDDLLMQTAWTFDRYHLQSTPSAPAESKQPGDKDAIIFIQRLDVPQTAGPEYLNYPAGLIEGLQTVNVEEVPYRVLVKKMASGERFAFAQQTDFRDDLSTDSALRTLMPFLILVPVLLLVVHDMIKKQFLPVAELAGEIDRRSEGELHPIAPDVVPTEIRPFVVAINEMLARVRQTMEDQRRFIADAAHELRSPLTALSIQAERVEAANMPAETRELLIPLRRGIDRGRALIEQLLAYARLHSKGVEPSTAVSLQEVYRRVLEDLLPLAEAKSIDIGIKSEGDAFVHADPADIMAVVKNLVVNAITYTPDGGAVDLWVEVASGIAILNVEDNGPGIAEPERAHVFRPFYRSLGTEKLGSGLGLTIVKTIVDRLGGDIQLLPSSLAPTGLRVSVRFQAASSV